MSKRSRRRREARLVAVPPRAAPAAQRDDRGLAIAGALVAAVAILYAQVRSHAFVNFDDSIYAARNSHVMAGLTWDGLRWAFTTFQTANWHPLTWLSLMLDVTLFGRGAAPHVLINAALHALNCVLLFLWLRRATATVWLSAVVAALFAVHPLHVESVAWVSERKDTLSAAFFLLTLLLYTCYVQSRSRALLIGSVVTLGLGLLAKPMLVTAPFILLLIDYWPLRRMEGEGLATIRRLILEKIGFFALIVPSIGVTIRAQREAMPTIEAVPLTIRLANAATSYVAYVVKTFWPAKLSIMYPYRNIDSRWAFICVVVLAFVTIAAIRWRGSAPWFFVGWFWFVGSLVPVIGIVQVGLQSMADRYTYIPHIGLFVAIVWSVSEAVRRRPIRRFLVAVAIGALVALSCVTYVQVGYWANSRRLFQHALAVTTNNRLAHVSLGSALLDDGEYAAAEREYRAGQGFRPAVVVHIGLALSLSGQGRLDEASVEGKRAVAANPNSPEAMRTLGTIELSRGRTGEAERLLRRSAEKAPEADVLGRLALIRGDLDQSRREFERAIEDQPDDGGLHNDLAAVLARRGDDERAISEYRTALRLNPNLYDAHMNYGAILSRRGLEAEAIREFEEATRLRPRSAEPYVYLALAQANRHLFGDAAANISRAISIDHDASNRFLTNAVRLPGDARNVDRYLAFLRQQER